MSTPGHVEGSQGPGAGVPGPSPQPGEAPEPGGSAAGSATPSTDGPNPPAGGASGEADQPVSVARMAAVALREAVIVVGLALLLSLVAKTWLVQSFYIPSGSMLNTLAKDDRVMVSKLTPGPFELSRGDIVVFEDPGGWLRDLVKPEREGVGGAVSQLLTWVGLMPSDEGNHLIKRVIGLPGDRVACCAADGRLTVNGVAVSEPYVFPSNAPSELEFSITVPAGKVWVMGDHRSDSADSRYNDTADVAGSATEGGADARDGTGYYGSVPMDHIVGRAFSVVWPLSKLSWLGTPSEAFAQVPPPSTTVPKPSPTGSAPVSSPPSARSPSPARVPVASATGP